MDHNLYQGYSHFGSLQQDWERSGVDETQAATADEDLFFDWDALYSPSDARSGAVNDDECVSWMVSESSWILPSSAVGMDSTHLATPPLMGSLGPLADTPPIPQVYTNVTQWLDGAYRPPAPCNHCRRNRLQCLILRTTPANPNPVTACSSCVALFRTCSLAQGEKRQASGFETSSPVLGHLHGVTEQADEMTKPILEECTDLSHSVEARETKQFVRKGARVLRDWFYQHEECPYPSEEEKVRLSRETGFSRQRISTWFANARRRQKQKRQPAASIQVYRAGSPMPTSHFAMTPMERWQASPPDEEPVSEAAIQDAIASTSLGSSDGSVPHARAESHLTDISSGFENASLASSLSSFGSMASEGLSDSASSAWSHNSAGEAALHVPSHRRHHSTRQRRGRRRPASDDGRYQCTFCTQSFQKKHDWARHEKSVHFPLEVWICAPDLNQLVPTANTSFLQCRYCESPSLTQAHWDSHDFSECSKKPISERSFSRKDYLWQHLRKFHGCTRSPVPDLDAWRSSLGDIQSRCGFCGLSLAAWSERADHLASHFKEGSRMAQWTGDWGFDPSVLPHLRNAIPPSERALANRISG